jgi:Family of unknown function (DUF6941)
MEQSMSVSAANFEVKPFNVVFCDDIRREISGKDILIGAYSGDIIIPSVPAIIPIAMWIQIRTTTLGTARIRIKIIDPAGNKAGQTGFEFQPGESVGDSTAAVTLPPLMVSVTAPGAIKVYWATEGEEMTLIGEKTVRIGPVPTASLPPSGQSPSAVPPPAS